MNFVFQRNINIDTFSVHGWVGMGLGCAKNKAFVPHPSSFMLKSEMIFYSLRHSKSRREGYLIGLIAMNRA